MAPNDGKTREELELEERRQELDDIIGARDGQKEYLTSKYFTEKADDQRNDSEKKKREENRKYTELLIRQAELAQFKAEIDATFDKIGDNLDVFAYSRGITNRIEKAKEENNVAEMRIILAEQGTDTTGMSDQEVRDELDIEYQEQKLTQEQVKGMILKDLTEIEAKLGSKDFKELTAEEQQGIRDKLDATKREALEAGFTPEEWNDLYKQAKEQAQGYAKDGERFIADATLSTDREDLSPNQQAFADAVAGKVKQENNLEVSTTVAPDPTLDMFG